MFAQIRLMNVFLILFIKHSSTYKDVQIAFPYERFYNIQFNLNMRHFSMYLDVLGKFIYERLKDIYTGWPWNTAHHYSFYRLIDIIALVHTSLKHLNHNKTKTLF